MLSQDIIAHSAEKLSNALQNPHPSMLFHNIGAEQLMALEQLSENFHRATNTSKDNKYTPYTVHPISIPERIKTVDTTSPPRVQEKKQHHSSQ
eukprot:7077218-Ditylum_brightwellii.AAC.1